MAQDGSARYTGWGAWRGVKSVALDEEEKEM
jgi:hypothetical protein